MGVGLAAFLAMAGAGAAFALGGSGSSTTTKLSPAASPYGSAATPGAKGRSMKGLPGGPAMLRGGGALVHGIYTTRTSSGYQTMQIQTGTVNSGNSDTSITVNSPDGYSQTYSIQPSTVVDSQAGGISTVKSGDTVTVQALQQGKGYTATNIVDRTEVGASRRGFGLTAPAPPGGGTPTPGPATPAGPGE